MNEKLRISQEELARAVALRQAADEAGGAIKAKLLEGAEVEPGEYYALVEQGVEPKGVTKTLLVEMLGQVEGERVWSAREQGQFKRPKFGKMG